MKNLLALTVISLFTLAAPVASQNYLTLGAGYGFSIATDVLVTKNIRMEGEPRYENIYGSFGKGFAFCAGFGHQMNSNLDLTLAFRLKAGSRFDSKDYLIQNS